LLLFTIDFPFEFFQKLEESLSLSIKNAQFLFERGININQIKISSIPNPTRTVLIQTVSLSSKDQNLDLLSTLYSNLSSKLYTSDLAHFVKDHRPMINLFMLTKKSALPE
jgi:hypothetical protein